MKSKTEYTPYTDFGLKIFGPFLLGFTLWLERELSSIHAKKVFFLARDGYKMKKAYDTLAFNSIKTEYAYFSRRSISQALLCFSNSFEDSLKYLSVERYISLYKLLGYYGFSDEECKKIAETRGICINQEYAFDSLQNSHELSNLYNELEDEILSRSKRQNDLLVRYTQQIGMTGFCPIVDIGWYGTMQKNLELFFKLNNIDVSLYGFYVGINLRTTNYGLVDRVKGYLFYPGNYKLKNSLLCFFGGYEKLFQIEEGSTIGYRLKDDCVVPVLKSYEYKDCPELICKLQSLQTGALSFVKSNLSKKFDSFQKLALPLINVGRKPTLKDINLFSFFYIEDGKREYFVSNKSIFKYSLKEFLHALSNSTWKTGFLKSVFKIPFPYYWVYSLFKK